MQVLTALVLTVVCCCAWLLVNEYLFGSDQSNALDLDEVEDTLTDDMYITDEHEEYLGSDTWQSQ